MATGNHHNIILLQCSVTMLSVITPSVVVVRVVIPSVVKPSVVVTSVVATLFETREKKKKIKKRVK